MTLSRTFVCLAAASSMERMLLLHSRNRLSSPVWRISQWHPAVDDVYIARDVASFACRMPLEVRLLSRCRVSTSASGADLPSMKTSNFQTLCRHHAAISKVRSNRNNQFRHVCSNNLNNETLSRNKTKRWIDLSHSQEIESAFQSQRQSSSFSPISVLVSDSNFEGELQSHKLQGQSQRTLSTSRQMSVGCSSSASFLSKLFMGNAQRKNKSSILHRTFKTVTCLFDKDDTCKSRELSGTSDTDHSDDVEGEEEWIHPEQRNDVILEKDPELKSLLRELASDFGREDHHSGSSVATSVQAEEDEGHHTGSGSPDHQTREGKGIEEDVQEDENGVKNLMEGEGDQAFEPVLGKSGKQPQEKRYVFSIDDLVSVLQEENAQDMCVISIPKEKQYVDFFVVVTGRSPRHLKAMALHINQQYKARKTKEDPFVLIEGEQTDDWICIDFGNIVLHLMSEETREFYELEKLWTLGPEYDDQLKRMREYDEKMKDILAIDTTTPQERGSDEHDESDRPTITFVR